MNLETCDSGEVPSSRTKVIAPAFSTAEIIAVFLPSVVRRSRSSNPRTLVKKAIDCSRSRTAMATWSISLTNFPSSGAGLWLISTLLVRRAEPAGCVVNESVASGRGGNRHDASGALLGGGWRSGSRVLAHQVDELGHLAGQGGVALDGHLAIPQADHRIGAASDNVLEVRDAEDDAAVGGAAGGVDRESIAGEVERPLTAALTFQHDPARALDGGRQLRALAQPSLQNLCEELADATRPAGAGPLGAAVIVAGRAGRVCRAGAVSARAAGLRGGSARVRPF